MDTVVFGIDVVFDTVDSEVTFAAAVLVEKLVSVAYGVVERVVA